MVTLDGYLIVLTVGAVVLAVWTSARFPGLGPTSLAGALLHLVAALVVGWLAAPLLAATAGAGKPEVGLLAFVLPSLTYLFLAGGWLLRAAQWPDEQRHEHGGDPGAGRGVRS